MQRKQHVVNWDRRPGSRWWALVAILSLAMIVPVLHAEEALPAAKALFEQHIKASGGREAMSKINTRSVEATFEVQGLGVKGAITGYSARPNKMYHCIDMPELGKFERGCDGTTCWEDSAITGGRVNEGETNAMLLNMYQFDELDYDKNVKEMVTEGIEKVDGKDCYKVTMTPTVGKPSTLFFSKETGLMVKAIYRFPLQQGEIAVETTLSDFKEVDGIKMPHTVTEKAAGKETRVIIKTVKCNVPVPPGRFDVPEAVKAKTAAKKKDEKPQDAKPVFHGGL